jgi:acylphosphatase
MKQAHIYISGMVQGVGFRGFIKSNAKRLGLKGWVRNLPDGRVEAILQGEKQVIESMIEEINKGNILSEVREMDVIWEDTQEVHDDFTVVHKLL